MHFLWKHQPEQTDVGPFRHVRPDKIKKTQTGGYGLLRLSTRTGLWMRRSRKLLWQGVLTMDKLDACPGLTGYQLNSEQGQRRRTDLIHDCQIVF